MVGQVDADPTTTAIDLGGCTFWVKDRPADGSYGANNGLDLNCIQYPIVFLEKCCKWCQPDVSKEQFKDTFYGYDNCFIMANKQKRRRGKTVHRPDLHLSYKKGCIFPALRSSL